MAGRRGEYLKGRGSAEGLNKEIEGWALDEGVERDGLYTR